MSAYHPMKRCQHCKGWYSLRAIDCPYCGAWTSKDVAKAMGGEFRRPKDLSCNLASDNLCPVRITIYPSRGSDSMQHPKTWICPEAGILTDVITQVSTSGPRLVKTVCK